jgi:hypothetical protein
MSKPLSFWGANFHIFFPEKYDVDTCKGILWKEKTPLLTKILTLKT